MIIARVRVSWEVKQVWVDIGTNVADSIWRLCLRLVLRLRSTFFLFASGVCSFTADYSKTQNKNSYNCLIAITSNVVAGLRNGQVHVFT